MRIRRELDFLEPRPDGYGLAWFRPEMGTLVYYPIPLHVGMRLLYSAYLWFLWGGPSRRERMLQEARQAGALQEALYHRGRGPNRAEMAQLEQFAAPRAAYTTGEEYTEANRLPEMEQWRAEQDAHRIKHIDTEITAAHEGP